jgi:hypothetical protein
MKKSQLLTSLTVLLIMLGLFGATASATAASRAAADSPGASEVKAESPDHRRVRIVGVVVEVREGGFLMRTQRGPIAVRVTDDTTIRVMDDGECVDGSLEDIAVGERAMVAGLLNHRYLLLARGVSQCPPSTDGAQN